MRNIISCKPTCIRNVISLKSTSTMIGPVLGGKDFVALLNPSAA